jgi:hypothetical protein
MLQYKEIILAEKHIIRYVQKESFARLQDKRIACLDPFLDEEGIIRLKTRIAERADVGDFAIPAVLPFRHPIVERLMLSTHVKSCHVGVQGLLSLLREKFWILKGWKSVRAILLKCVMCRRRSKTHHHKPTSFA